MNFGKLIITVRNTSYIRKLNDRKILSVKDKVGLHARPASLFVKLAQEFDGTVLVKFNKVNKETGEEELVEKDGKSMIGILSLGIAKDKPFTLVLDGNTQKRLICQSLRI